MRIDIVGLDGAFDTGLTAMLDIFSAANELVASNAAVASPISVRLVGPGGRMRTALGFSSDVKPLGSGRRPDWVLVPALNAKTPHALEKALERSDVRKTVRYLGRYYENGGHVGAACIGTFILGDSGILNGKAGTTIWSLSPLFRQRYPAVDLDASRMIVPSGRVVTAGAAMGHLDLALWLVRRVSPDLAAMVARVLLIDQRDSQARYIIPNHLAHADPLVSRFERWARENMAEGFSLQSAAEALNVHSRTLQRRTESVLGKSPLSFFQDLRVERAQHLVSVGMDLESVAAEVGYEDASTLRTLIRRKLGRGVRDIRGEMSAG